MTGWISVKGWRTFQHYDPAKRQLLWVKNYTDLLSNEDYLGLTPPQRAVLHGLWLEYAASRCQLAENTSRLSSRLGLRVTKRTLDALVHAGFIEIVASKSLADGYQPASPEKNREETPKPPSGKTNNCPECGLECKTPFRLAEHRETVHHVEPLRAVS